ncbi:DUF1028 domain-containing protein [Amaricoccus sp.]|uniref:DUF1028 domain-containing protein n=1 Tax=Amaricoccus sp. TaxID=1872485 RepID=UPI00260A79FB|nr:DUF1028 domain-containing protein [uncultured Amaricoccus sp.]
MAFPLAAILRRTRFAEYRQILAVDRDGNGASHSGPNLLRLRAEAADRDVAAGGDLLAGDR